MYNKIILSLLTCSILVAQDIELEPIKITSTAIQTDELKSSDAVEVYTSQDIEKAHVNDIYEFLNQETSVTTMPGYGNQYMQKIDIRGYGIGDGHQNIVIMLDGRRLNNMDLVPQLLGAIPTSSIKSIEIIKSSGIVIAGDGANAGVINIRTKNNNDKEISVYAGTNSLADASVFLSHSDEKLSISVAGEVQKSDVIRDVASNSPEDENKLKTASLNLTYFATDDLELKLGAAATDTTSTYAGYLSKEQYDHDAEQEGASTTIQDYDTKSINLGLSYNLNSKITFNINGYKEDKESDYNYVTYSLKSSADYDYESVKADISYEGKDLSLVAGFDFYDSQRETSAAEVTKENSAGYLAGVYSFGANSIKAGLRYEDIKFKSDSGEDQDDDLWGVELGYNLTLNDSMSVFINYAHSYQSADLDRLFSYSTGAFNGYVDPSEADNYNIGFNYITKRNKLKVAAYYIDLEDEIYYYSDPSYLNSRNTNIDQSHKYGLDIYDKIIFNREFNAVVNYNYIRAKIDKEKENGENYKGSKLPGVSDHNIKATLSYLPTSRLRFSITQIYRSEAYAANDFNNDFDQKQDEYKSTNISVSYTKEKLELFAKINNLFDQENGIWVQDDVIYPVDFTTTAFAGFRVRF